MTKTISKRIDIPKYIKDHEIEPKNISDNIFCGNIEEFIGGDKQSIDLLIERLKKFKEIGEKKGFDEFNIWVEGGFCPEDKETLTIVASRKETKEEIEKRIQSIIELHKDKCRESREKTKKRKQREKEHAINILKRDGYTINILKRDGYTITKD